MILEFEKIFFPYLLLKKKRYIGLKYEPDGDDMICKGIDAKGVETERKDTLPFLKKIYIDVRDELMHNKDAHAAFKRLEEHLWRLIRDEVPFEELILSKGLRSTYKDASTQVQCCVNEKKRKREPGSESAVGDRVWYVIVNGPDKAKTTELAEDPDYARKNGLKLNRLWYFEHAIRTPMASLFSHIKQVNAEKLFEVVAAELKREKVGGSSLRGFVDTGSSSSSDPLIAPGQKRRILIPPPPPVKRKKK
jgi:DNA polymerase delta subunit 1